MTRPKVDPANRQRTAQACNSCKRRKQKCNGLQPCNTCTKRQLKCHYGLDEVGMSQPPSPMRRLGTAGPVRYDQSGSVPVMAGWSGAKVESGQRDAPVLAHEIKQALPTGLEDTTNLSQVACYTAVMPAATVGALDQVKMSEEEEEEEEEEEGEGEEEEEAIVYTSSRLLQDPRGRLLYIGDSASLSYLQLVRMIVETVSGPSPFTTDPQRHRFQENLTMVPTHAPSNNLLPDLATVQVLLDAFFLNTTGLIEVFDRRSFLSSVGACFADPLRMDANFLCLLHLTLAIGLVLATPTPGSPEDAIVQKLRADPGDRADVFYHNARGLMDPTSVLEDARLGSVQVLLLMTVYLLAVARRNAAYSYFGMAVRFAFAMGIHREETMAIYSSADQAVMRNLWRSLFVIDRFLAASLGRPISISEDDCSGDTLLTVERVSGDMEADRRYAALDASVKSSHFIGLILKNVYSTRKVSTTLAQELIDSCKSWLQSLDPSLHVRYATASNPTQTIAVLHVHLFYLHAVLLLTRPFFLFLLNESLHSAQDASSGRRTNRSQMEQYSQACVEASCETVALVQHALDGRYLPHCNPFVTYFLFAASLVLLSNEFFLLCSNPRAPAFINSAISIMAYSAALDPQAQRLLSVLTSFHDVVKQRRGKNMPVLGPPMPPPPPLRASSDAATTSYMTDAPGVNPSTSVAPAAPRTNGRTARPHPPTYDLAQKPSELSRGDDTPRIVGSVGFAGQDLNAWVYQQSIASSGWHEPSHDSSESMGDAEVVEFESFWNWPAPKTPAMP